LVGGKNYLASYYLNENPMEILMPERVEYEDDPD
jgi:hypothetical protein